MKIRWLLSVCCQLRNAEPTNTFHSPPQGPFTDIYLALVNAQRDKLNKQLSWLRLKMKENIKRWDLETSGRNSYCYSINSTQSVTLNVCKIRYRLVRACEELWIVSSLHSKSQIPSSMQDIFLCWYTVVLYLHTLYSAVCSSQPIFTSILLSTRRFMLGWSFAWQAAMLYFREQWPP